MRLGGASFVSMAYLRYVFVVGGRRVAGVMDMVSCWSRRFIAPLVQAIKRQGKVCTNITVLRFSLDKRMPYT